MEPAGAVVPYQAEIDAAETPEERQAWYERQQGVELSAPAEVNDPGAGEATGFAIAGSDGASVVVRAAVGEERAGLAMDLAALPGGADLLTSWGADAGENMGFALAVERAFPGLVREAGRHGLHGAGLFALVAALGRELATRSGDPAPAASRAESNGKEKTMTTGKDEFDDRLDELREQQREASGRGNHAKADRLYAQEQELIAQRHGRQPIVNGQRTA